MPLYEEVNVRWPSARRRRVPPVAYATRIGLCADDVATPNVTVQPVAALVISDVLPEGPTGVVTHHRVTGGSADSFILGSGTPVEPTAVAELLEAVGVAPPLSLLPESVLACALRGVAWWRPAVRRAMYFALGSKAMALQVHWPALLFVGRHSSLRVFALAKSARPTLADQLYQAPLGNINAYGQLCWGSIAPFPITVAAIDAAERVVYDTPFTHANAGKVVRYQAPLDREGRQDIYRLWKARTGTSTKPLAPKELIPLNLTLADALNDPQT